MTRNTPDRSAVLAHGPLCYAPENELGVVFLFAHLAPRLRLRIEAIRPQYPDCLAYRRTGDGERRVRIEFEHRSSNFVAHRHDPRQCDMIVCWDHDWPDAPHRLEVLELRRFFDLGRDVWIQPAIKSQWGHLKPARLQWAVSKRAKVGDLLLMYRCTPISAITDVFCLMGPLQRGHASWRDGDCYAGTIRRVCSLSSPLFLSDLRSHRVLRTAPFVRGNMQGNLHATEYWPYLYELILGRNAGLRHRLSTFRPEVL